MRSNNLRRQTTDKKASHFIEKSIRLLIKWPQTKRSQKKTALDDVVSEKRISD